LQKQPITLLPNQTTTFKDSELFIDHNSFMQGNIPVVTEHDPGDAFCDDSELHK
jgi:hypothetical protein